MVLSLTQLHDDTIERLLADPPLVWLVVSPDDPSAYERSRQAANAPAKPGFIARMFGAKPAPAPPPKDVAPFALREGEGAESYYDKSWNGMHFLFTGTSDGGDPPLNFLMLGGRTVGDEEVGYDAARVMTSAEVREVANAVAALSDADLRARFDPKQMEAAGVYPDIIWVRDREESLEYVMAYVGTLRETLAEAVAANRGLLIVLS